MRIPDSAARAVGAFACGYALGLLPSAQIVARGLSHGELDLSSSGSRNPGAMNAYRLLGRRAGVAVACADVAKGAAACFAGRALAGANGAHTAGVGAVAGHCYPLPRRLRGGKGVATSFGQCVATFPAFAPLDLAVAFGVMRLPRSIPRRAAVAVAVSSTLWTGCGMLWWKRRLPNLWGPPPSAALPLANAATTAVIASRALLLLRRERAGPEGG